MSDAEPPDVYRETHPRARKRYPCCESGCRRVIEPGDRYQRATGLWDGEWYTFRSCERCDRLRARARRLAHDRGYPYGYEGPEFGRLLGYLREVRAW